MEYRITQCPACHTSFKVTGSQLKMAAGAVRCGSCLQIFRADDHWIDEPPAASPAPMPAEVSTAEPSLATHEPDDHATDLDPSTDERLEPVIGDLTPAEFIGAVAANEVKTWTPPDECNPETLEESRVAAADATTWYAPEAERLHPEACRLDDSFDNSSASPAADDESLLGLDPSAYEQHLDQKAPSAEPRVHPTAPLGVDQFDEPRIEEHTDDVTESGLSATFVLDEPLSAQRDEPLKMDAGDFLIGDDLVDGEPSAVAPVTAEPETSGSGSLAASADDHTIDEPRFISGDDHSWLKESGERKNWREEPCLDKQADAGSAGRARYGASDDGPPSDITGDESWAERLLVDEEAQASDEEPPTPADNGPLSTDGAPAIDEMPPTDPLAAAPLVAGSDSDAEASHVEPVSAEEPDRADLAAVIAGTATLPTRIRADGFDRDSLSGLEPEPLELQHFPRRRRWPELLWGVLLLLGLCALAAQYVYFNFATLARGEMRPWMAELCGMLDCQLPAQHDATLIETGSLVVRSHPAEPDALAVDAILTNEASFPQPYPQLLLQFTDLNGEPVAGRRFAAAEYLEGEMTGATMMPVRQPVRIAIELVDPGPRAVNYHLTVVPFSEDRS